MKSLVEQIKESLLVEVKNYTVVTDEPNNLTDYIKLVEIDENAEVVDEFGFMKISQIKNPKDDKWVSEVGIMCKKHFGLSRNMSVSISFFDEENEGDWVQFAVADGTGNILLWAPESLECDNPFI
jgi:hypothetical protein